MNRVSIELSESQSFNSTVMFCSESCRQKNLYHRYDCEIMYKIRENFPKEFSVIFRSFFRALALFDGDLKAFVSYAKENAHKTILDFDLNPASNPHATRDMFVAVMNSRRPTQSLFSFYYQQQFALINLLLFNFYPQQTHNLIAPHMDMAFILEFLVKLKLNVVKFSRMKVETDAIYPIVSMIHHSCVPNTRQLVNKKDGTLIIMVVLPIQQNAILTRDYTSRNGQFAGVPWKQRESDFLKTFGDLCNCNSCLVERPIGGRTVEIFNVKVFKELLLTITKIDIRNPYKCLRSVDKYRAFIEKHIERYPNKEMFEMQNLVFELYQEFSKLLFNVRAREHEDDEQERLRGG